MVKINETADTEKKEKEALERLTRRIKDRCESIVTPGILRTGYAPRNNLLGYDHFHVRVRQRRWFLSFIPYFQTTLVFGVDAGAFNVGTLTCCVFDRRALDIVREEVKMFAEEHGFSDVNLERKF